ncbi:MAG TPA: LysR family transcriptional regulator ArgP [Pseudonocardiaceae bacterium]|jgi:LysR family transcriptional regulator (chromosome initiation inhibitor)|nr:LysR family transcriptional regulator ArgP [Pseudonocardiaceae bacterium]
MMLDQARTLLAVVDEGTLDAAAVALHVTPSAVSQRVKALEQQTGRVLLIRTKPVRLTESGEIMVRYARRLAQLERDTMAELGLGAEGEPARIAIAVNADSLATWFLPAIATVPQATPIRFELRRADQDNTATLLREGLVMAAVTSAADPVAGCSARRLGRMRYLPVASPGYLDQWSHTALPTLVSEAPVVVFDRDDDIQDRFARAVTRRGGASGARHYVPSTEGFRDAVVGGMGWGLVPQSQAEPLLRAGALVNLAPDRPVDVPLFWQQWKLDSPALAATATAVLAAARAALTNRSA